MTSRIKYGLIGVGFLIFLQAIGYILQYGWPS